MKFEIRKYNKTFEDWRTITLVQVFPCFNFGNIENHMERTKWFNVGIGWLFWILEWSWRVK